MAYLADTNVISELARPQPNAGVMAWARTITSVALSVITLEEIFFGLTWKPNPRVQAWLEKFLVTHCEIYPITRDIAHCAGQLRGTLSVQGQPRTQADMLIAATALVHQQTLVTRNVRDFAGCGIAFFNPFT